MDSAIWTTSKPDRNQKSAIAPHVRKHGVFWAWTALLMIVNLPLLGGEIRTGLIFLPEAVDSGQWWRVVTYPLVHLSLYHLLLDAGGFLLLLSCLEERRGLAKVFYIIGPSAGSLGLALAMDPIIHQNGLSGLSGIAHGLMAVCAMEMVRHKHQRAWGVASLTAVVGKSAYELWSGQVLFEFMHMGMCGQPVAASHAGGVMGGLLAFFLFNAHRATLLPRQGTMARLILVTAAAATLLITAGTGVSCSRQMRNVPAPGNECVILLHGLCRSALSMKMIENGLEQRGYAVVNINYASTRKTTKAVANEKVAAAVTACREQGYERIHFVTHSLGGLVVRRYLQHHKLPHGSRIVMLAPPNQGSELADWAVKRFPRLSRLLGPAARELTTQRRTGFSKLNPITPQVGIIIGNNSWNPLFSKILPGSDDGKVTVARAKLEEMRDFWVAPCNHTTILLSRKVLWRTVHFIQTGRFAL
ncbi:MAG: rhombosortase [Desulfobacteraceae bacterium]|jgi:rhomboid family GlyGly-CTERM serine protease